MIVGPIAILVASAILQVAGVFTSVQSSVQLTACLPVNSFLQVCPNNPSILQIAVNYLFGPLIPGAGQVLISPLADAASVGFLLAFIALLPMASFDGGHVCGTLWGAGKARVATYLSVVLLLVLDTNELLYWGVAIVVLLIGGRPLKLSFMDEVSAVSRKRVLIYLLLLVIAFLAIPIPHDIATLPLT
jgi:membrane-associated protease RseP (regulator of RpoE activity)